MWRYSRFSLLRGLTKPCYQRVMLPDNPVKVSYHSNKFGGHTHSDIGDKMI